MTVAETYSRWRYRLVPDHILGEILTKRWADNATPFFFLILTIAVFGSAIPDFFSAQNLGDAARQLGEFSLVVMAMTLVMLSGGSDLSVGANIAVANYVSLARL